MRKKVILACTECSGRNYSTHKKAEKTNERLEVNKFCTRCNGHTLHRETK
ncbi:50S ribosomal protein L33 [Salimicrobium sp. PL1-032A]